MFWAVVVTGLRSIVVPIVVTLVVLPVYVDVLVVVNVATEPPPAPPSSGASDVVLTSRALQLNDRTGCSEEVGITTFAQSLQVEQMAQVHLMNHGCPLGAQRLMHWRRAGLVLVVVLAVVLRVIEVVIVSVVVVVVHTGGSTTPSVKRFG